ncbi:aminotransferase class I/II-fold pyridoxal phosphate-dependent enzyme [Marinimicrobium sp. ARAG 43.8]|uniref:aminotransferase class I/II-fold pyridoxal phosphate-dependent enzyme n=1 Tax=Marinimicrobium sp. ARAG 43.8 TaxID=3418719 RepID=UPI003CF25622
MRHGGNLDSARSLYGEGDWQDLSTGISPWSWPVPPVPNDVWQRLPEPGTALCEVAASYYRISGEQVLPLPGSQFGIARLPTHVARGRVALPCPGYREHERAWVAAGHQPVFYRHLDELDEYVAQRRIDHLVLINPNNPTGERLACERVERYLSGLNERSVVLVDEAFIDLTPERSVAPLLDEHSQVGERARLWVLRSLGKFFGLAGVRLGFLLGRPGIGERRGAPTLFEALRNEVCPWGVSHPAQWIGCQALRDRSWQEVQRERLLRASAALEEMWQALPLLNEKGRVKKNLEGRATLANGGLFVTLRGEASTLEAVHHQLAQQRLWLRLGDSASHPGEGWLRCGLPEDGGERLRRALGAVSVR